MIPSPTHSINLIAAKNKSTYILKNELTRIYGTVIYRILILKYLYTLNINFETILRIPYLKRKKGTLIDGERSDPITPLAICQFVKILFLIKILEFTVFLSCKKTYESTQYTIQYSNIQYSRIFCNFV